MKTLTITPVEADQSADRRRSPRWPFVRGCKVLREGVQRFESATTANVSTLGALVEVRCPRAFGPGERVRVGVSWEGAPLIESGRMVEGRVVRARQIEGERQEVAVCFDLAIKLPGVVDATGEDARSGGSRAA
jgi:hypothetical protein